MAKEIFDQYRPRSAMARRLDEAFAGCDQWTLAPPAPRRSESAFAAQAPSAQMLDRTAAAIRAREPRAL